MDPRKLSAQELVRLCLESKDEAMWTEFVRRFQPLIARVASKSLCRRSRFNLSLVDDLVQDTFLKICVNDFKALRVFDFRTENALYSYLKVIALHVIEDHFRKRDIVREAEDLDQVYAIPSRNASPEFLIRIDEIERILQTLSSEPNFARDRTIFWLYYRDRLTAKEISERPGIVLGVKGVESVLLRLTRFVRERLKH